MKYRAIAFIMIVMGAFNIHAQGDNIREVVYTHLNSQWLIAGEMLHYSAYCLSEKTQKPSPLSKFLYVELVGEKGAVHQAKLTLNHGRGGGSFFVSTLIPTGKYYLLAYTRWMKNFAEVSRSPLYIVNPYENYEAPSESVDFSVDFRYLNGALSGEEVEVAYRLTGSPKGATYKAKLVSSSGEVLNFFVIEKGQGLGIIRFTPEGSGSYQLILEDQVGELYFFDLPNATGMSIDPALLEGLVSHLESTPVEEEKANSYRQREFVSMPIDLPQGTYSVSVRPVDGFPVFHGHAVHFSLANRLEGSPVAIDLFEGRSEDDWKAFLMHSKFAEKGGISDDILLPEVRDALMSGRVSSGGTPLSDVDVSLSFSTPPYQMNVGRSDENGAFTVPYKDFPKETQGYLTVLHHFGKVQFQVDPPFLKDLPELSFSMPGLDSALLTKIIDKSIRTQIYNAFYEPAKEHGVSHQVKGQIPYVLRYDLDEYKRFPTLQETFTEFVAIASMRVNRDDVIKPTLGEFTDGKPLILLDGVPVDSRLLIDYSAHNIKTISVLNRRFFVGPFTAYGVVGFETVKGHLAGIKLDDTHRLLNFKELSPIPTVVNERVEEGAPDLREQLYWEPMVRVEDVGQQYVLSFHTSDITGQHEIIVEGFSVDGTPVTKKYSFQVRKNTP